MQINASIRRILSIVLALTMLVSAAPLAMAADSGTTRELTIEKAEGASADLRLDTPRLEMTEEKVYADTDSVRVSIVLEDAPTLELYSTTGVAENAAAMAYRDELKAAQDDVSATIENDVLEGSELDVVWNMTLAANIISANVEYGQIEDIAAIDGVAQVIVETAYDPMESASGDSSADTFMATSSGMIGAGTAWASGYTGAGTRIAIIDTGLDTDHQSFNSEAYLYSLEQQAAKKGLSYDEYVASLDLLDAEEIAGVFENLNIYPFVQYTEGTANGDYYVNEKIPFAMSYVDRNYEATHDDGISQHGSHVAGIAAANSYIENGEGGYDNALDTVYTQGVAPDAQIIVMKVFSAAFVGAYDSDYMAAIEDAIMLGCDVVNLSLGANKGFARSALYQDILDNLEKSNTIVAIAAGNAGQWAANAYSGIGYLYAEDIDMGMMSTPAAATNSLAVGSVENVGTTDYYVSVDGSYIYYNVGVLGSSYTAGLNTLPAGDYDYILVDGIGSADQVAAAVAAAGDVSNAIFVCARGQINFAEKAQNAYEAGFAGAIIYNNTDGVFNMNLEGYTGTIPAVSITMADGATMLAAAEPLTNEAGETVAYKGSMYVSDEIKSSIINSGSYEMSDFSSWGLAGSLELKPEISAPGGNIYSVDGSDPNGDAYMLNSGTSMATPQVAGMAAVAMQYIKENGLEEATGMTARQLATSLLMSTATPLTDSANGDYYYPVMQQGAGSADLGKALQASTYIKMDADATSGASDGKVKVELGDDPDRSGSYSFGFTINNFSDAPKTYSLSSDFFTQDVFGYAGMAFLDTWTTPLAVDVAYTVDSESLTVSSEYECDLNGDELTDDKDAQIILDYAAGNDVAAYQAAIDAKADLSADGSVNTYDAHLLLASMRSGYFQVEAGESVHVEVTVELTDKETLDAYYVNGAYIEGFVFASSAPSEEGEVDVDHSIPVIGFYGNWSDATMYDRADYEDYFYYANGAVSDFVYPYSGGLNYLTYFDDNDELMMIGNPYIVEDVYPEGREALGSKTELGDFVVTLIRNAGGFLYFIKDETTGELVHSASSEQMNAAYYYDSYGYWVYVNSVGLSIWETPKSYGFTDGDKFTIGFMSVPEYYETNGTLSTEELVALMESGTIGDGAFHTRTFTVDDTEPEILGVEKDTETGNLIINAKDNNYIAAVAVLNSKGSNVLTMTTADQDEANTAVETVVDMSEAANYVDGDCMVMVADYAGNETFYKVTGYNDGYTDYTGRMYGFTNAANRGTANSWMEIVPSDLYYSYDDDGNVYAGGTYDVANMPWGVNAAEYVNGYIYMVTTNNELWVAEQGDWENASIAAVDKKYANIKDMAYNEADGKLYVLYGTSNTIYSMDLVSGELTKEYTVSIAAPTGGSFTSENLELLTLACDDEGNFYAVNNGNSTYQKVFLYSWSSDDAVDGKIKNLAPVNDAKDGYAGEYVYNAKVNVTGAVCIQSMAWDSDADTLYWAAALSSSSPSNILYVFDTETGKASKATDAIAGMEDWATGVLSSNVSGLYIVPSEDGDIPESTEASGITLERNELSLFESAEYQLGCDVFPWNLNEKGIVWTSSDETVATVDEDGVITALKVGTATITATTKAQPELSASCTVTVEKLQNVNLRGLLYDENGIVNWVEFGSLEPENWTVIENGEDMRYGFIAGGLLENTLYLHDGNHMYGVDANTFEVTDYGYIDISWQWSDADQAPKTSNGYFDRIVGIINGGKGFGVMDVREGIGSEMTHYGLFRDDSAAVIAYKGETSYTDSYGTYPALEYYVLTEGGDLYLMTTWGFYDSDAGGVVYTDAIEKIGETGLRLNGVADVSSGKRGSMFYDEATGYLIVSVSNGNVNKLYAFEPDMCAPVEIGEFGTDVWPVVALHQYSAFTELTVLVDPDEAEIYVGEETALSAKVYQYESDDSVTWRSMDESIATVDEDGIVTGIKEGTVEIRAYAAEGAGIYGSATVTVKALTSLDVDMHAYITTAEGGKWVSISGADLSTETLGTSDAVYTGAAVSDGKIYATDSEYYYEIDPEADYAAAQGDKYTDAGSGEFMYMLDGTSAPASTVTMPDAETLEPVEVSVGGKPVYISGFDGVDSYYMTVLNDYTTGDFSAAPISMTYVPAAVAYHSSEIIEDIYYFDFYYVLGYDGLLETYSIYSAVIDGELQVVAGGWESDTMNTGLQFADGDDVSMAYVNNDTLTGVIISHATENGTDFYVYDIVNKTLGKMGRIDEATDLVGLSLLSDIVKEEEEPIEPGKSLELHGYLTTDEGYLWASIDPATGAYETLGTGTVPYVGAGVSEQMIYGAYGETKYGNTTYYYYQIDPANGYTATQGTTASGWGYNPADGAGAPASTVTLNGSEVNVGGYFVYASNGKYSSNAPKVYVMSDYTKSSSEPYVASGTFSGKFAAISFLKGSVSEDGSSYYEDFLILGQDGSLYNYRLTTTTSGLSTNTAAVSSAGSIDLTATSGASMTRVDDDTLIISVNADDGVQFYSLTVSTGELTEMALIEDATNAAGISLMSDITGIVDEEPAEPTLYHGYLGVEDGYVWASIDADTGAYETLGSGTVPYVGAGVSEQMIYGAYGETKYGNTTYYYYQIDPANGYTATQGTTASGWGYNPADGAGAPAATVELFNESTENYTAVNVGGYYVYASNGKYSSNAPKVLVMKDYTKSSSEPYVASGTFSGKFAAISFLKGSLSGDEMAYYEDFLILGQDGSLYNYRLTTTTSGLGTNTAAVSSAGSIDLTATSGASMTRVDDDTVMIAVNADDGVQFYSYTISTGELTEKALIEDAASIAGLSLLSDVLGETGGEEPEEPEETATYHGLIAVEDGYLWAEVDPATGSYEELAAETVPYVGVGVSEQMLYGAYGETKYGNTTYYYYEIDPANGYEATQGANVPGFGYNPVDGTGAPASTVEIFDEYYEDYTEVAVGGYFLHASNGKYSSSAPKVYVVTDYTDGATEPYVSSSTFSGKLAAVTYLKGSLSGDELAYYEDFLILAQDGSLYNYRLTTTTSGLQTGTATVSSIGSLDFTALSGASMARIDDDNVMLSVNADDGVQFYSYKVSTAELTELAILEDAVSLAGLSAMSELDSSAASASAAGVDYANDVRITAGQPMALPANGSLMSVMTAAAAEDDSYVDEEKCTVSFNLVEDVDVTNGVIEVTYDPAVLVYEGASSGNAYFSVNSSEAGKLVVAYASGSTIAAGEAIAGLKFSYTAPESDTDTVITVTATERGEDAAVEEDSHSLVVALPGTTPELPVIPGIPNSCAHDYDSEVIKPARDNEEGKVRYTCSKCGHTYTESIRAYCYSADYVDLKLDAWYHEATDYVIGKTLMKGVSDDEFAPNATLTRAMLATVLYRIAGEPEATKSAGFEDVKAGAWYTDAINWAAEAGIVTGYSAEKFGPNDPVTREQMATMLWRYAKSIGIDTAEAEATDISGYADASSVREYAVTAMKWANGMGIITGVTEDTLVPQGNATRVQVAAMLMRFCENVLN